MPKSFPFYVTKFFNTFEGGAVVNKNDDALAAKMRLMKNFGFAGYDNVVSIGTNGKMNEVSAAMGSTGLESLGRVCRRQSRALSNLRPRAADISGVRLMPYDANERFNFQYVVLEIDAARTARDTRRAAECLVGRECASAALFLFRLSSDGAVPEPLSRRRTQAAGDRGGS